MQQSEGRAARLLNLPRRLCLTPTSLTTRLQLAAESYPGRTGRLGPGREARPGAGVRRELVGAGGCSWVTPTEAQIIRHKHHHGAAWHQAGQEQLKAALPAASRTSVPRSHQCQEGAGLYEELVYQPKVRRSFWTCVRAWREGVVSQQRSGQV